MKTLELHYPMIQFLINNNIAGPGVRPQECFEYKELFLIDIGKSHNWTFLLHEFFSSPSSSLEFFSWYFPLHEFFFVLFSPPPPPHHFSNGPSLSRRIPNSPLATWGSLLRGSTVW